MKITFIFDTDSEDGRMNLPIFEKATEFSLILFDIKNKLREETKYKEQTKEVYDFIDMLTQFIADKEMNYALPNDY